MQIRVLGGGAGGGFPQWNCFCPNCRRLRAGKFAGTPRTQAQIALSAVPGEWTLLNASPDLRAQIEATPELWPQHGERHSPISAVILTGAEVDQVAGLLTLREFHPFGVYATAAIRKILVEDNNLFRVLSRVANQVSWHDISPGQSFCASGVRFEPLPLPGKFPTFASESRLAESNPAEATIGLMVSPESGGGTVAFLPGIGFISDALLDRLAACDVVFLDGTFWNDYEPLRIPGITRTARQMGHLPVSGAGGSIERLAALNRPRKVYIHINNTNPILDEESAEYRAVVKAGWEVAWDGMEMTL